MKYSIILDPPINAPEFDECWKVSSNPNIALKGKHDYVYIEVECDAKESIEWFLRTVKDRLVEEPTLIEENK